MSVQLAGPFQSLRETDPAYRSRIIAGFVAAIVVALSSWGSAAVLEPYIASLVPGLALTSRTGGSPLAATFTLAGLAVMVWAWWDLRRAGLTPAQWRNIMLLWAAPLLVAAPLQSRDMYSYAAQGQLLNEGLSPYTNGVRDMESDWVAHTSAIWLASPSPYGPFWLMLARAVAMVSGGSILIALLGFRLLGVGALLLAAWAVTEISTRLELSPQRAAMVAWLALANPFVLTQVVGGGHNDALVTALILVAVVRAWDGRLGIASMLVALAAMIKVTAVVALPFIALLWLVVWGPVTFQGLVKALARAVGYAAVPSVLLSLGLGLGFAWMVPVGGLEEGISPSLVSGVGIVLGTIAEFFGADPTIVESTVQASQSAGVLLMAIVLVITFVAVAGRELLDSARGEDTRLAAQRVIVGLAVGLATTAVLAPTIRTWYILWFLPVAALAVTRKDLQLSLAGLTAIATVAVLPDGNSANVPGPVFLISLGAVALLVLIGRTWLTWAQGMAPAFGELRAVVNWQPAPLAGQPAPQYAVRD